MTVSKQRTAYREAGHVVALYARGILLDHASIVKNRGSLGRVVLDRPPEFWRHREGAEEIMFALLVSELAGVKAVEIHTGQAPGLDDPNTDLTLHGSDFRTATNWYLEELCGADGTCRARVWREAMTEAEWVLRSNWPAVEAVAEGLQEHNGLGAAALQATVEASGCERNESAVKRALLDEEHERLVARSFELTDRARAWAEEGTAEREIQAVVEELQQVEQRTKEIAAFLWPKRGNDA